MIRILLIDDHPLVRSGIVAMLAGEPDLEITAELEHCREALDWCAEPAHRADVALVDLTLPDGNGIDLIRRLRVQQPALRCVVLTARSAVGDLERAQAAGAVGYLFKTARRAELLNTIRVVAMGGQYISPTVSEEAGQARSGTDLTAREIEVLRLMARGLAHQQIAQALRIGAETVKSHCKNIFQKLGVHTRSEAAALAWRLGLIET